MKSTRSALFLTLALAATPALAQQNLNTISDDLVARAGQAYGNLDTVSGDIAIQAGSSVRNVNTVSGDIDLAEGATTARLETVSGDIEGGRKITASAGVGTVSGDIFFDHGSRIGGDLESVSGDIGLVGTRASGGIETVSGDITVGAGSHVKGGIRIEKPNGSWGLRIGNRKPPRIVIGPNAVVEGSLVFEREVTLHVHQSARIGKVSGASVRPYTTATPPRD